MARPIKETPILKGKDAKRFMNNMSNPKKASAEDIKKAHETFEKFRKIANFTI